MKINQINAPVFKGNIYLKNQKGNEVKIDAKNIFSIREKESNLTDIYTNSKIYTVNAPINTVVSIADLAHQTNIDVGLKASTTIYEIC